MGLDARYEGEFRYFSSVFAEAAVEAARQCYQDAVERDGGCSLEMSGITRAGDKVKIDYSIACPASIAFGADGMLRALASTALEGSATATIDYDGTETQYFRAQGQYASLPHSSWPAEPEKRKEIAQHLLGRHLMREIDFQIRHGLFDGFPKDQHDELRGLSLRVVRAVLGTFTTDGNYVDGNDEAGVWYKLFSRVETCQGEFLEEIEVVANGNYAASSFADDEWQKGRLG